MIIEIVTVEILHEMKRERVVAIVEKNVKIELCFFGCFVRGFTISSQGTVFLAKQL